MEVSNISYSEAVLLDHNAIDLSISSSIKRRETEVNDSLFITYKGAIMSALANHGEIPEYEPIRLTPKTQEEIDKAEAAKQAQMNRWRKQLEEELGYDEPDEAGENNGII